MIYKQFHELQLSSLGLGCMRFPQNSKNEDDINESAVAEMIEYAMSSGINYFDTAWIYHGGASESVIGSILSKYPRESYYLATKYPGFDGECFKDPESIFQTQLKKCCVDYFDFYLFHNVCENNIDDFMSKDTGVADYLFRQKQEGKIKHLGFSTHGSLQTIKRFLDAYASELEFCQIQLNYLDWELQNAKAKVELIRSYGLPIWVMEPVRGGRLAQLNPDEAEKLKAFRPDESAASWAFRFLQDVQGVTVVLSGMSNMQQLQENIATFSTQAPLTAQEHAAIMDIAHGIISSNTVPCTGCSYCVDHCPQGLRIPEIIKKYNDKDWSESPDCIGCQSCETVCPQGISIAQVMQSYKEHI